MVNNQDTKNSLIDHYDNDVIAAYLIDKIEALSDVSYEEKITAMFKYDQFHIGGALATQKLFDLLNLKPSSRVLDVGSGFGGVARYLSHANGCSVVAVDLVDSYVALAKELHDRLAFKGDIKYLCGDVRSDLPEGDSGFDAAALVHVGMNIEDKVALFKSIHDKLAKHGRFIIYDLLLNAGAQSAKRFYPLPWTSGVADDYCDTYENYKNALSQSGFKITHEEKAEEFSYNVIDNDIPDHVAPLIGAQFHLALENLKEFLAKGHGAPWFIIAEKV